MLAGAVASAGTFVGNGVARVVPVSTGERRAYAERARIEAQLADAEAAAAGVRYALSQKRKRKTRKVTIYGSSYQV